MLQGEGCHTIGKGHIPEGAVDARVAEAHGEVEGLLLIASVACYGFGDSQAAKFIFRIGKRRGRYHIFLNRSGISCFGCRIAVLIRFRLRYFICNPRRKPCCRLALTMFQCEGRRTIRKFHISIRSTDRLIAQCYREMERLIFISRISCHRF